MKIQMVSNPIIVVFCRLFLLLSLFLNIYLINFIFPQFNDINLDSSRNLPRQMKVGADADSDNSRSPTSASLSPKQFSNAAARAGSTATSMPSMPGK
jgi:hypothetical protein